MKILIIPLETGPLTFRNRLLYKRRKSHIHVPIHTHHEYNKSIFISSSSRYSVTPWHVDFPVIPSLIIPNKISFLPILVTAASGSYWKLHLCQLWSTFTPTLTAFHTRCGQLWMKGQFLSPRGFVERLRKAFSVEMKAESPGRKGNSSPERGRKGLAGGAMKETVARSKVPNVDSIFFKSLKGFSRGWSSGPMAACRNQWGNVPSLGPGNKDWVTQLGKPRSSRNPVASCPKGNQRMEWRLEEVWEAQPCFGQKVSNNRRKGNESLPVQSALHGGWLKFRHSNRCHEIENL